MGGAIAMGTCMLVVAILGAVQATKHTSGAAASIAFIYLESMSYQFSWGALSWVYLGEIFPNRIREVGIAIGAAAQWLFNFAFSQITPHAVNNIGWKTFLMFAIFNYFLVVYTYFVIREVSPFRRSRPMLAVADNPSDQRQIARGDGPGLWRQRQARRSGQRQKRRGRSFR